MSGSIPSNGVAPRETTRLIASQYQQQQQQHPSYQQRSSSNTNVVPSSFSSGTLGSASINSTYSNSYRATPAPSAAQLAAAAAIVGGSVPTHMSSSRNDVDDAEHEVSDSEMEDSIVLKDGRRFPTALKEKHVSFTKLLAIIYICVVGGPFGLEDAVLAAGVSWVCILLIVLPWTVNLPIGLLTSELASAMPQNGGYIIWVSRAFGNFWGFLEGWFSWSSTLVDTALYPFLIVAYFDSFLMTFFGVTLSAWVLYGIRVSLCLIVMFANLFNFQMQGTISLIFAFLCVLPFGLLTMLGFTEIDWPKSFTSLRNVMDVNWGLTLSVILWVGSGWDSPGTVAGDVKQPKKTYPRAVTTAVVLVMFTNILPVLVAFSVEKRYETYVSGNAFWAMVAYKIGGYWLQILVTLVGIFSNLNLLHVLLTSSSWSLYALALPGLLDIPSLTKLQSSLRTPWVCIFLNTAIILVCCLYTFAELIQVTMTLNGLAIILQCMALVWLRISEPKMKRPYRIPASTGGVACFMLLPMAVSLFLLLTVEHVPQVICACVTITGVVLYMLSRLIERVHQPDSGMKPAVVDLQDVFEDVVESVGAEGKADDIIPDLGFRSSILTSQLPESIRSDPTEINDNATDLDHSEQTDQPTTTSSLYDKFYQRDDEEEDDDETTEEKRARMNPIEPIPENQEEPRY